MKKVLISTAIIVLTASGLSAQDVSFGIKGGLNMANIDKKTIKKKLNNIL